MNNGGRTNCERCGAPIEEPIEVFGDSPCDHEVRARDICSNCVELLMESPQAFWQQGWGPNRRTLTCTLLDRNKVWDSGFGVGFGVGLSLTAAILILMFLVHVLTS